MTRKTWIKLKRGLLDPKHRDAMGVRLWVYLHILDRADWEQGAVLVWKDEQEAESIAMPVDTLRDQRMGLQIAGYIRCDRHGDHQRITILKWVNPREYSGQVYNPPDLAGTPGDESLQNLRLLEDAEAESPTESPTESLQLSPPLPLDSHVTCHKGEKSADDDGVWNRAIHAFGQDYCLPRKPLDFFEKYVVTAQGLGFQPDGTYAIRVRDEDHMSNLRLMGKALAREIAAAVPTFKIPTLGFIWQTDPEA
jgi:hypothetical protein